MLQVGASCGPVQSGPISPHLGPRGCMARGKQAFGGKRWLFGVPRHMWGGYGTPTGRVFFLLLVGWVSCCFLAPRRAGSTHCPNNCIHRQKLLRNFSSFTPYLSLILAGSSNFARRGTCFKCRKDKPKAKDIPRTTPVSSVVGMSLLWEKSIHVTVLVALERLLLVDSPLDSMQCGYLTIIAVVAQKMGAVSNVGQCKHHNYSWRVVGSGLISA